MRRLSMMLIFMILILGSSGCQKNECSYPKFPIPSQSVLSELSKTHSEDVTEWLKELYKLKLKLDGE